MATLVSPGLSITVSDESQYVPAGTGTVPLVIFATAQDKLNPSGDVASGTTKVNANTLNAYGSQRELINAFGYPTFKKSAGTAVHGDELNEYGLHTAYSVLGLGNSVYALRADIDMNQLVGTSVRPKGSVPDSTIWLDLSGSKFGIFVWDQATRTFTSKTPILITATEDTTLASGVRRPISSIGLIGDYAIVLKDANNPVFYKNDANTWVAVGTDDWATSWPTIQSSIATLPVVTSNIQIRINTTQVTMSSITAAADVVTRINAAAIDGVTAALVAGRLVLYADSTSASDGTNADGQITIAEGDDPGLSELGLTAGTYALPELHFGSYTAAPAWNSTDVTPRPTGSIWVKTSVLGAGANWTFKTYNATTDAFTDSAAPLYADRASAIYALDVGGGGFGIAKNTLFLDYGTLNPAQYPASFKVYKRVRDGVTKITGSTPGSFTVSDSFTITVTQPGTATKTTYTVTLDATTVNGFVAKVLSKGIPNFSCQVESSGNISFTHRTGGEIELAEVGGGSALADGGFTSATSGIIVVKLADSGELVEVHESKVTVIGDRIMETEDSLKSYIGNLITETKKRKASETLEPMFVQFLTEKNKQAWYGLTSEDREKVIFSINESKETIYTESQLLYAISNALSVKKSFEDVLVENMPQDLKPIWGSLNENQKLGIISTAKLYPSLDTPTKIEKFWESRKLESFTMINESKKVLNETRLIDNTSLSDSQIDSFINKIKNLG